MRSRFAAAVALTTLAVQGLSLAHLVLVRHAACEHGEPTHGVGSLVAAEDATDARDRAPEVRNDGDRRIHEHGCGVFTDARVRRSIAPPSAAAPIAPSAAAPLTGAAPGTPAGPPVLSLAPSRSPPSA